MSFNRFIYVSRDLEAARPPPLSLELHYSTRCEHLMLTQHRFLLKTWSKWLKTPPQESQLINMSPCYFLWAMSRGWLSLCVCGCVCILPHAPISMTEPSCLQVVIQRFFRPLTLLLFTWKIWVTKKEEEKKHNPQQTGICEPCLLKYQSHLWPLRKLQIDSKLHVKPNLLYIKSYPSL